MAVLAFAGQWCPEREHDRHARHEGAFFCLMCREVTAAIVDLEQQLELELFGGPQHG